MDLGASKAGAPQLWKLEAMDEATYAAAKRGDVDALTETLEWCRSVALRWARRFYPLVRHDHEDVAQGVALKIWKAIPYLEYDALVGQVCRETRNEHRRLHLGERWARRDVRVEVCLDQDPPSTAATGEQHFSAQEIQQLVIASKTHGPVIAALISGEKADWVQSRYGVTYQAAAGKIKRARKHARKILEKSA